jgi:hypothetical protein
MSPDKSSYPEASVLVHILSYTCVMFKSEQFQNTILQTTTVAAWNPSDYASWSTQVEPHSYIPNEPRHDWNESQHSARGLKRGGMTLPPFPPSGVSRPRTAVTSALLFADSLHPHWSTQRHRASSPVIAIRATSSEICRVTALEGL